MARLTAAIRNRLPSKDFAIPEKRAYPIEDRRHAELAVQQAPKHPEWAARIRAAVARKFPGIRIAHVPGGKRAR